VEDFWILELSIFCCFRFFSLSNDPRGTGNFSNLTKKNVLLDASASVFSIFSLRFDELPGSVYLCKTASSSSCSSVALLTVPPSRCFRQVSVRGRKV
jgi:hypothetical protein